MDKQRFNNLFKDSRTNWRYIAIVVILGIIAGIGILWYEKEQEISFTPLEIEKPEKTDDETVELVPSEVEGWQTYRNEEYGFELKYPSGWEVSEEKSDIVGWEKEISFISTLGKIQTESGSIEIENGEVCIFNFLGGPEKQCLDIIPYKFNIFILFKTPPLGAVG